MYRLVSLNDTIRIPPERFGDNIEEVTNKIVQETFEGTIKKDYGLIVVTNNIKPDGDGIVIHGDGGLYQKVDFDALVYQPILQEIVDAVICEIVEFGAFCHIGPMDALIHMSQIMNDYVDVDSENERITGKENKRVLKIGDGVRARIVAISLNELSARESKIGLTMRQPQLGSYEWLKEEKQQDKDSKDTKKTDKKKKGKK